MLPQCICMRARIEGMTCSKSFCCRRLFLSVCIPCWIKIRVFRIQASASWLTMNLVAWCDWDWYWVDTRYQSVVTSSIGIRLNLSPVDLPLNVAKVGQTWLNSSSTYRELKGIISSTLVAMVYNLVCVDKAQQSTIATDLSLITLTESSAKASRGCLK